MSPQGNRMFVLYCIETSGKETKNTIKHLKFHHNRIQQKIPCWTACKYQILSAAISCGFPKTLRVHRIAALCNNSQKTRAVWIYSSWSWIPPPGPAFPRHPGSALCLHCHSHRLPLESLFAEILPVLRVPELLLHWIKIVAAILICCWNTSEEIPCNPLLLFPADTEPRGRECTCRWWPEPSFLAVDRRWMWRWMDGCGVPTPCCEHHSTQWGLSSMGCSSCLSLLLAPLGRLNPWKGWLGTSSRLTTASTSPHLSHAGVSSSCPRLRAAQSNTCCVCCCT